MPCLAATAILPDPVQFLRPFATSGRLEAVAILTCRGAPIGL